MFLLSIGNVLRGINKWICHLGEVCIAIMGILITVDVLLRLLFNSPILGAYEICQMLLLVSLYGSFAYLQSCKGHVSVNLLVDRFPAKVRTVILGLCYAVATICGALWSYGAFSQGIYNITSGSETALLKIPYWPFYLIEGVCMAMFTIVMLLDTITLFAALGSKGLAEEVSHWEGASTDD